MGKYATSWKHENLFAKRKRQLKYWRLLGVAIIVASGFLVGYMIELL